jgi:hypothetical protein
MLAPMPPPIAAPPMAPASVAKVDGSLISLACPLAR